MSLVQYSWTIQQSVVLREGIKMKTVICDFSEPSINGRQYTAENFNNIPNQLYVTTEPSFKTEINNISHNLMKRIK